MSTLQHMRRHMRTAMRRIMLALVPLLLPVAAFAQGAVLQAGPKTPGHAPMYVGSGSSGAQTTVQDSGPAGGGAVGLGLSEILGVKRGTGAAPYQGQGTGPFGTAYCFYDAPITNAGGYHYLCFDPYSTLGGGLIAYGSGGAATPLPLYFNINGTTYPIPVAPTPPAITTIITSTTLTLANGTVLCDASLANVAMTLPVATPAIIGTIFRVKKVDSSSNICTLAVSGGGSIDTTSLFTLSGQGDALTVQTNGTQWWIL